MIELLRNRRSIRKFTNQSVEDEKTEIVKRGGFEVAFLKNINPWEFIFVDDLKIIMKLKECKPQGVTSIETAPLAVIVCADETKNDVWIEDCSIASILLQLTAQSLELGSCWIQIRNRKHSENITSEEYIHEFLTIPENFKVLSIITIGYPMVTRTGKSINELQFKK